MLQPFPLLSLAKTLAETQRNPWVTVTQMCWKTTNAAKHKGWNQARQTILWISRLLKHFGKGSQARGLLTGTKKGLFQVSSAILFDFICVLKHFLLIHHEKYFKVWTAHVVCYAKLTVCQIFDVSGLDNDAARDLLIYKCQSRLVFLLKNHCFVKLWGWELKDCLGLRVSIPRQAAQYGCCRTCPKMKTVKCQDGFL